MNRSIAFAATSLSAILLVAATLSTAASAQDAGRNIDISKKKFPTLSSVTPGADTSVFTSESITPGADTTEELAPSGKGQTRFSTIEPGQTVDNGGIQDASVDQPELFKSTIEPGETVGNNDDQIADGEDPPAPKPKKKFPKVLQPQVDENEEAADVPELPVKPKKPVDAATSDDVEDEEEIVTKEVEEKPPVEAAEIDDEEAAPTFNKKFRMRYSPSLRRYVQVTDEDFAHEAVEYQEEGYEVPTYRRSYSHGYGQRRNYNYLPSCEN